MMLTKEQDLHTRYSCFSCMSRSQMLDHALSRRKTGWKLERRTPKSQLLNLLLLALPRFKIISLSGILLEKLVNLNDNLCNIIY